MKQNNIKELIQIAKSYFSAEIKETEERRKENVDLKRGLQIANMELRHYKRTCGKV